DDPLVRHAVGHLQSADVPRAVLAEVGGALLLLLAERLALQRGQVADVVGGDAEALADPLTELVLAHEEVPDHALLDLPRALLQRGDEVEDEVVLLPLLAEQVALPGLL